MCSWYYEMSSFLKTSPGTASRAMSLLDRFMNSGSPQAVTASKIRDEYQLAALTALFVAIKLYDRLHIMPCHVSYLSRGRYTSEEVIAMELVMLQSLEWRVTTPTKLDYANLILDCVVSQLSVEGEAQVVSGGIRDLTGLQIQLSDFYAVYSHSMQSMVALAAAMNAYEVKKNKLAECDRMVFRRTFRELLERYPREAVYEIMDKLCRLVDPSSERRVKHNHNGNVNNVSSPNDVVSTSNPPAHTSPASSTNIHATCEESSLETFDAALETMENINFFENWLPQHFLCCGSIPLSPDSVVEGEAVRDQPNSSVSMSTGTTSRHCDEEESTMDLSPGGMIGNSHSFDSRGSVKDNSNNNKCRRVNASKPSPTSIATMLFGISS